jgi:hypothetical protein
MVPRWWLQVLLTKRDCGALHSHTALDAVTWFVERYSAEVVVFEAIQAVNQTLIIVSSCASCSLLPVNCRCY